MPSLLHHLLVDLKRRGECVLQEVTALQNLPASFDAHRADVVVRLNRALLLVEQRLNDPDLSDPKLEPNFFIDFKRLSELILKQTQASELLALPDLYHELAHFVLFRRRAEFEVPLLGLIHKYFVDAIRKGKQQGLPKASLEIIRENHTLWTGS